VKLLALLSDRQRALAPLDQERRLRAMLAELAPEGGSSALGADSSFWGRAEEPSSQPQSSMPEPRIVRRG
jgi:hypothetical protein